MAKELRLKMPEGGNQHPIAVKQFILDHLARAGEDFTSSMHRAYMDALDALAVKRGRKFYYHHPTDHSFRMKVSELKNEGLIEFSGREEAPKESDPNYFKGKKPKRFYRLKR